MRRFHRGDATALAAAVVRRPATLLALTVLVLNDHALKQRWPGIVTGKVSDVVWPVVAVPLVALLLAPAARRVGRDGWAVAAAALAALPFVAVNLSPVAAEGASRLLTSVVGPSVVTVDPTDLLVLPVYLLPLRWLQRDAIPPPRQAGRIGPLGLAILGLATLGTAATSCYDTRPRVERLGLDEDGHLIALVERGWDHRELARSHDAGETWHRVDDGRATPDEEADPSFTATVSRLRGSQQLTACGVDACFRIETVGSTIERTSPGAVEELPLVEPRHVPPRFELGGNGCGDDDDPRSADIEVMAAPAGGDRAVVARSLEGVVLVDDAGIRPVAVLDASPPDRLPAGFGVIERPEVAVVAVAATLAWGVTSAAWWAALAGIAAGLSLPRRPSSRSRVLFVGVSAVAAALLWHPLAFLAGPWVATVIAAAVVSTAVAFAWLATPIPAGWRSVPFRLATHVALPSLAAVGTVRAWSAGWPRDYPAMLAVAIVLAAGAFGLARRVAPLPSTDGAVGRDQPDDRP